MAIKKAKIITISSAKGGSGKTTTVLNLAGTYSLLNKKILILDFDLYSGEIALSLNVDVETDLYKLSYDMSVNDFKNIDDYILKYNEYIDIIPAPKDPRYANKIETKYISSIIKKVNIKYDVILIDTNHTLDGINLNLFDNSDTILYVINNSPSDLKNMKSILSIYKDMEKENFAIILNTSTNKLNEMFNRYDIKNIIKNDINYIIPNSFYNKNINRYVLNGKIMILDKRVRLLNGRTIKEFNKIALELLER
ncbi:MAG: ParA family protein [Bacilli bacterium]|nr:ParA family protein [Bacilli bacterium]